MKKIILAIMLIAPLSLIAQKGDFTLKGNVGSLNTPAKVFLRYRLGTTDIVDSKDIKNGLFEFKGTINDPVKAEVCIQYLGTQMPGPAHFLPLYLEPGLVKISSPDSLTNAKITGLSVNKDNEKLKLALKPSDQKMATFISECNVITPEKQRDSALRSVLNIRYEAIIADQKQVLLDFIKTNTNSLVSLDALEKYAGSMPDLAEVEPLYNSFSASLKNSTAGKEYAAVLSKMKAIAVGDIAPDFTQNDPDGKPIKLSSFRGQYLLVDFWASWCGPCRAENPNVVKAYAKYHNKGFEILGVSLDNDKGKENWLKAIKSDNLTWPQVSDLKYWENEVAVQYYIRSIPTNFLLDKTGKIIGKNLIGVDLEKKLAEIFEK